MLDKNCGCAKEGVSLLKAGFALSDFCRYGEFVIIASRREGD